MGLHRARRAGSPRMIPRGVRHTLMLALLPASCSVYDVADTDPELDALRAEVAALRAAAGSRLVLDTVLANVVADSDAVAIGLRVGAVRDILSSAANRYLSDVRLHLRPNVVVNESDTVAARVGPLRVEAGHWELAVTIQRVNASLSAESIEVAVTDSNRLDITVLVRVSEATGRALIDFRWDAATATSVVCGDFSVREAFTGYVSPRTYQVRGNFRLVTQRGEMLAVPVVYNQIPVSPQPTEASWARVREILNEQNQIFNCGIAMSPSDMETKLRELLTKGFRFRLPSSIIRAVPLPGSIRDEVDVAGRRAALSITPQPPELNGGWLWLRAAVRASARGEAPIQVDPAR
jgi:hypothetical protein